LPDPAVSRLTWLRPTLRQVPLGLLASLAVLTGAAWVLTIYQAVSMSMPMGIAVRGGMATEGMAGMAMGGMAATGWSFGGAALFVAVWTVMMVAMMLPAAASMVFMFASAQARRGPDVAVPTWIFVAGYILVWAAAGLVVYALVQAGSDLATRLAPPERASWAPLALGITVAAAGLYQFTPLKRVCLNHCRSPLAFVALHWREGRLGALGMGLRHGIYCLGCCWALFAVLVAAGVMSMAWMLLLTFVVFAEKMFPHGRRAAVVTGVSLIAVGIVVAFGAVPMPWLAQPQ
jgi:predicted metal-binding membrane protein